MIVYATALLALHVPRAPLSHVRANAFPFNEFSRPIPVESLGKKAVRHEVAATTEECAALAKRFKLESLGSLSAKLSSTIIDPRRTRVRATGTFNAEDVKQAGLAKVQIEDAKFETFFSDDSEQQVASKFDSEEDDAYDEPIEEGQIDLGELVAQHLYLYLTQPELDFDDDYEPGEVVYDSKPGGGSINI